MIRLESVQNAVDQAKVVAENIIGNKSKYDQIPWFWSNQYDMKIQIAGINTGYDNYVIRQNPKKQKFSVFYLKKKKIIAVECINDSKSFINGKKLILSRIEIEKNKLKNNEYELKDQLLGNKITL